MTTDKKLADAIAKAEQWTCLVCDEPEIERTILVALEALAEHDAKPHPLHKDREPRFFLDHGVVHDRKTGRHVGADFEDDSAERLLTLLRELENERDAWRYTAKAYAVHDHAMLTASPVAPALTLSGFARMATDELAADCDITAGTSTQPPANGEVHGIPATGSEGEGK